MKKEILFKGVGLFLTMLLLITPLAAAAPKKITLKVSALSPVAAPFWKGVAHWADLVEERTNQEVTFERFPVGQLYSDATSEFRAVSQGILDVIGIFGLLIGGVKPGVDWASIPGAVTFDNWLEVNKALEPIFADYFAQDNLKLLGPSFCGSALDVLFSTKVQFKKFADFKGKKVYSHSKSQLLVAQKYGAGPISMPMTEVYTGLQRGQVDMAWSAAAAGTQAYKWNEQAPYVTSNVRGGIAGYYLVVNMDVWQKLTPNIQTIMIEAAQETAAWSVAYNKDNYGKQINALKTMVKGWYEIPQADAEAQTAAARKIIWPEFTKQGPVGVKIKEIVESFQKR